MSSDLLMAPLFLNDGDLLLAAGALLIDEEVKYKEKYLYRFNFTSASEEECWNIFQIQKDHVILLKERFHIPEIIHLKINQFLLGLMHFAFLDRLAYPC